MIDLTPAEEEQLLAAATAEGVEPPVLVRKLVTEHLPALSAPSRANAPMIDSKNQAAIEMLKSWLEQEASDDPEAIRRADAEVEELKRNLNANRAATGERLVFR